MSKQLNIGDVAKRTGLSAKTIRFYEDEGCIPPVARAESGYRVYSEGDVWRLTLVRQLRLLGLPLSETRDLVSQSLDTDCANFAGDLTSMLDRQKREIDRRIAELEALRSQIGVLEGHIDHCECDPGSTVGECYCCSLLFEEGGDPA
jgi:MerR family copper efflux transcriptional regulator